MELAKRKSPRATWLDYNEGEYFVTVCTQGHKHFFGNIHQGKMLLSEIGKHLVACIENTPHHQPHIRIVQYVVMPNHFHMILHISDNGASETAAPYNSQIPKFVSLLKRYCNRKYGKNIWQRSYNDHIIRGEADYFKILEYIDTNTARWQKDCFYR